jgi:hypothetical protein
MFYVGHVDRIDYETLFDTVLILSKHHHHHHYHHQVDAIWPPLDIQS